MIFPSPPGDLPAMTQVGTPFFHHEPTTTHSPPGSLSAEPSRSSAVRPPGAPPKPGISAAAPSTVAPGSPFFGTDLGLGLGLGLAYPQIQRMIMNSLPILSRFHGKVSGNMAKTRHSSIEQSSLVISIPFKPHFIVDFPLKNCDFPIKAAINNGDFQLVTQIPSPPRPRSWEPTSRLKETGILPKWLVNH